MDTSWILKPKTSREFKNGARCLVDAIYEGKIESVKLMCPCRGCKTLFHRLKSQMFEHLLTEGFMKIFSLDRWLCDINATTSAMSNSHVEQSIPRHDIMDLLRDIGQTMRRDDNQNEENDINIGDVQENPPLKPSDAASKFYDLVRDADIELYPNCKDHSKLSCVLQLYHLKCINSWTNKSVTMLLKILKEWLPDDNVLPDSFYEVKQMVKSLGLGYEKIHACPNDCMLFWGDKKDANFCDCGASRWVENTCDDEDDSSPPPTTKKQKPAKVLRWFPLKPRLQRLFLCEKIASLMTWHHDEPRHDDLMRHPSDSLAWKHFDSKFQQFSSEPRNVRLALASDGFNPFGTMNVAHSTWPVILIPYNLPPWMVMKQPNFILSLLIPGPKAPGNKMDVYMQPLIQELKELWEVGIETFDASKNENFQLHAAILTTISDFPGYATLLGYSTKGEFACPQCELNTTSKWLQHGGKYCYMGHRRWLGEDHRFRTDCQSFDGEKEWRLPPTFLSGDDILQKLDGVDFLEDTIGLGPWKRKSILFSLPYWKDNLLRHSLDAMHIEKNTFENLCGTFTSQVGKSKDNLKARLDLEIMGIRTSLHPKKRPNTDKIYLPRACYQMTSKEKDSFLQVLKGIKVPDECSSNISRCVQSAQKKLIGLKSYDCHMMMQEFLPVALRGNLPDNVTMVVIELCNYFKNTCSKVISIKDLEILESQIPLTLCKMERIFPPSFFTVMIHLIIHLASEAKIAGPICYRLMYPVERYLCTLKSYVRNKAQPEGSIAEGYMADECLTFCSRYFSDVETRFNRPIRNDEHVGELDEESECDNIGRPLGVKVTNEVVGLKRKRFARIKLDKKSLLQAHRYVLFNVEAVNKFRMEHKEIIKRRLRGRKMKPYDLDKVHCEQFCSWFRETIERMEEQGSNEVTSELKWLARGPGDLARCFSGYLVNGFRFHTQERHKYLKTQNHGVVVQVDCESYASSRDAHPVNGQVNYYGFIKEIIRLNYSGFKSFDLFKCGWFDVNKGCKKYEFGITLVNPSHVIHTGANWVDDPYILASQAKKVYYIKTSVDKGWMAVRHVKLRDLYDMGEKCSLDLEVEAMVEPFDQQALQRVGMDDTTDIDATLEQEQDHLEEEDYELDFDY